MSRNFELMKRLEKSGALEPVRYPIPDQTLAAVRFSTRPPTEETEWMRALHVIRNQWRWAAAFALTVVAGVTAAVFLMAPVYEPTARIEIDPPGAEAFSLQAPDSRSDWTGYAETQVKTMQSDQLAMAVIHQLDLQHNRDFTGRQKDDPQSATPANAGGDSALEQRTLARFRRALDVQRDSSSWIVGVSFSSHDPKLAALVTNTLVQQFIDSCYKARHDAVVESTRWLSRQLDDIRARMDESNRALLDFQKSSGIAAVGDTQSTFGEKMAELNRQLALAQGERIQLEALLAKVNRRDPSTVPQINADPVIQELVRRLAAARADLQQTLVVYGKNHPKAQELEAQVAELERGLAAQQNSVMANISTSYAAARARENLLGSELKDATGQLSAMAQYELLQKEAKTNEDLYNTLYTKVKEAGIAAESRSPNIRWIDRAPVLDVPTRPRRTLAILIGLVAGIAGGIMLAFVRASFDNRIHSLEDMRNWTGLPGIALVPQISAAEKEDTLKSHSLLGRNGSELPQLFLLQRPWSAEAEAVRALFTSVRLSRPARPPRVLLVASALPGEGKTTIACNLAVALSRRGRTCLIDTDLRRATVADVFGVPSRPGLAEILNESCALEDVLVPAPEVRNLTLLPSGSAGDNADELINSKRSADVFRTLRLQFEFIVVDSAPILPFADALAISPLADGVIFVGRSGVSTRAAVQRSLELLEGVHSAPVLEVVLNGVSYRSADYRYHYGYYRRA